MATTNLYNSISGLLEISEKLNTKLTSFIETGAYKPVLANGSTSGLVYGGGDVTITNGQITIGSLKVTEGKIGAGAVTSGKIGDGAVTSAKIANGNVTEAKLDSTLTGKIKNGVDAWGKVSGSNGEWHTHANMATLSGIKDTDITAWNAAATDKHTHANLAQLSGITDAKITAWDNGAKVSGVTLERLSTPTAGYAASYQLKVNGSTTNIPTIDIVKDQFIKSAKFGWSTVKTSAGTGWVESKPSTGTYYPCIKIEVWTNIDGTDDSSSQGDVSTIYVPLADVFQEYVGGANIQIDGNVISLSGTLPASLIPTLDTSKLPSIPSSKLENGSTYQTAVTQAADWNTSKATVVKTSGATTFTANTVVLGNGSQQVKNSNYTIVTASGSFGTNTLATAPAITGYIAAQGFQKSGNYVTAAADLTADTIVMGAGGKAVAAGKKIVTASAAFENATSGSMIPTAGAVSSYFAGKTTNMVTRNGGTALTVNNLIVGAGNNTLSASTTALSNVVTATANFGVSGIIIGAANNTKTVKESGYSITTAKTDVSGGDATKVPTASAVKGYVDDQDTAAKNYLLNGSTTNADGVIDWGDAANAPGSLAYLNAQISDLLTRVSA